ncbi:hypothetical protein BDC45DRAFT_529680 [Circinella umbellata]|nr:hypothetical protein BDC45DRAFT_529680 [Circinella umbellata]
MPYTTYHTEQRYYSYGMKASEQNILPPQAIPDGLPRPEFMPTRLVRVSDMRLLPGSAVDEGYYDRTRAAIRIDNGKHKIIFGQDKQKLVKFEGLIQQICRQFNIRYVWYDQMCIDQNNKREKEQENRQIHKIYRYAQCTIALVPEFQTREGSDGIRYADIGSLVSSSCFKRMWTLEEVLLSTRVIVVGRNIHTWHDTAGRWLHVGAILEKPSQYNATKKDLSILCFGNYNTGIEGEHFHYNCDTGGLWETDFHDYHIDERILQVTCAGIPLHPSYLNRIITLEQDDLSPIRGNLNNNENLRQQQPGSSTGNDSDDCDNTDANPRQKPEYSLENIPPISDNTTVFEDIDKR